VFRSSSHIHAKQHFHWFPLDLLNRLEALCLDNRNTIVVLSGRDSECLEEWLGHLPNISLFAEHGNFQKPRGSKQWDLSYPDIDLSWRSVVIPILKYWEARTPGAFIEYKRVNLVWHYRQADIEYGEWQARELKNQLDEDVVSRGLPLEVITGKKAIEIRPNGIHKGTAIRRMLAENDYDFVLAIGDDTTDEDMFATLESMKVSPLSPTNGGTLTQASTSSESTDHDTHEVISNNRTTATNYPLASSAVDGVTMKSMNSTNLNMCVSTVSGVCTPKHRFSIVVGKSDSKATWVVNGVNDVMQLLDVLINPDAIPPPCRNLPPVSYESSLYS